MFGEIKMFIGGGRPHRTPPLNPPLIVRKS